MRIAVFGAGGVGGYFGGRLAKAGEDVVFIAPTRPISPGEFRSERIFWVG